MLEWLVLPALILVVILAIVTARPKPKHQANQAGQEGRRTGRMISGYRSGSS